MIITYEMNQNEILKVEKVRKVVVWNIINTFYSGNDI